MFLCACIQLEHKNIRGVKEDDVSLTLEDVKKMEFTQNVSDKFSSRTQILFNY